MILRIVVFWALGLLLGYTEDVFFVLVFIFTAILSCWAHGIQALYLIVFAYLGWNRARADVPLLNTDMEEVYFQVRAWEVRSSGRKFLVAGRLAQCSEEDLIGGAVVVALEQDPGESGPMLISGIGNFRAPKKGEGGGFNERFWYMREGWIASIEPLRQLEFVFLERNRWSRWKQGLEDGLARIRLPPFPKRLAFALIFGQGRVLTDVDRKPFARTGTAHVLAVSGLHVGIVYGLLSLLTVFIPNICYRRIIRFAVITCGLIGYSWLTGFSPSVVRSSIMFTGWVVSMTLERDRYSINGLWLAAFISLVFWPRWIFSAGFHLSYAAVAAILFGFKYWSVPEDWRVGLKRILVMMQVPLFAQLGTLAVSWYYFGLFPVYFLPANMLFTPLIALLLYGSWWTLALSFTKYGVWLAYFFGQVAENYRGGLMFLEKLPYAVIVKNMEWIELILLSMISWAVILKPKKAKMFLLGLSCLILYRCYVWFS